MNIHVENLGKKYGPNWVFRKLNTEIESGDAVAITGSNGSGKSTLLQLLSGFLLPSKGEVKYATKESGFLSAEDALFRMSVAAPYIEVIEDFTLAELLDFHFKFRRLTLDHHEDFIQKLYLQGNEEKLIKNFSSGMKQRLKLGLAFYSKADVVFLDEPTTNLDERGYNWYLEQVEKQLNQKTFIISSNEKKEYGFCNKIIDMNSEFYK